MSSIVRGLSSIKAVCNPLLLLAAYSLLLVRHTRMQSPPTAPLSRPDLAMSRNAAAAQQELDQSMMRINARRFAVQYVSYMQESVSQSSAHRAVHPGSYTPLAGRKHLPF